MQDENISHKSKVAVLGASDNPERYSNILVQRLKARGHEVFPIHPTLKTLYDLPVYPNIESLPAGIDVLSIYMNAERSSNLAATLLATPIHKVIFNPGAENADLQKRMAENGKEVVEACSLVLNSLDQI